MAYYIPPPEKVGGHVPRVPHQIAPMLPETRFFSTTKTRVFKKNWNYCCIQILVLVLITLKLQIGACNGQTSLFEILTIIMRREVRVLLGDHRMFVVGPFIFSFNWPIQTDRDVILHITANLSLLANLTK